MPVTDLNIAVVMTALVAVCGVLSWWMVGRPGLSDLGKPSPGGLVGRRR